MRVLVELPFLEYRRRFEGELPLQLGSALKMQRGSVASYRRLKI